MKLNQLIETKYVGDEKPQFTGFSAKKVVQTFFDLADESDGGTEYEERAFTPKKGLYITYGVETVEWLALRDGEWYSYFGSEGEYHVDPAKFKIDVKRAVYRQHQLIETKYADVNKPQYRNFSAEKVIETFFTFDSEDEVDTDVFQKAFYPKEGLYIEDGEEGDVVTWIVLRDGQWFSYVGREEIHVNPATFKIDMKKAVYRP